MNELKKRRFQTVKNEEMDYNRKIRAHRLQIGRRIFLLILVLAVALAGLYVYFRCKGYTGYKVLKTQTVETVSDAQYIAFADGVLKISRDGAIYFDGSGKQVWNQTYEMNQPTVDVCNDYVVIGNVKGNQMYILNKSELQGEIKTVDPIRAVEVSEKGTVAVMTEGESSYKIVLYDKKSTLLAQGEFHIDKTGYPIAIALSQDGIKLGVSFVNIDSGKASTKINFYNFGSVGQNEIDNLVGQYTYENTIVPQIEYLDGNVMVAYATNQVVLFGGDEKPEPFSSVPVDKEIKTVFYTDKFWGMTYDVDVAGEEGNVTMHELAVYDLAGKEALLQQFNMKYERVQLLENNEVAIVCDNFCEIYTFDGVKKFQGELSNNILNITKSAGMRNYIFLMQGEISTIRLK